MWELVAKEVSSLGINDTQLIVTALLTSSTHGAWKTVIPILQGEIKSIVESPEVTQQDSSSKGKGTQEIHSPILSNGTKHFLTAWTGIAYFPPLQWNRKHIYTEVQVLRSPLEACSAFLPHQGSAGPSLWRPPLPAESPPSVHLSALKDISICQAFEAVLCLLGFLYSVLLNLLVYIFILSLSFIYECFSYTLSFIYCVSLNFYFFYTKGGIQNIPFYHMIYPL